MKMMDNTATATAAAAAVTTTFATPIVCFHSSNRSSDEFLNVLPLFADNNSNNNNNNNNNKVGGGEGRIVIAIDILGFGNSSNPVSYNKTSSIDDITTCLLLEVCDKLLLLLGDSKQQSKQFIAIGSKDIGCYIATSLICRYPNRIQSCVLVNLCHPKELIKLKSVSASASSSTTTTGVVEKAVDDMSLNKLYVLQNKITNLIHKRQRQQKHGTRIQNLSTYDLGRDSRRVQQCPVLLIQITRRQEEDSDPSVAISDAVRLFTSGGGGGGSNIKIQNLFVDNHNDGNDNDNDNNYDLINENSKEFVSVCEEFILLTTTKKPKPPSTTTSTNTNTNTSTNNNVKS
jgi:pimeloyl-ACP methyl ester carboxylesterase